MRDCNMNGEFPFPQTLGRQRDVNTVAADPNAGKIARPTQFEAQSLVTQVASYVNNWLGNISKANKAKDTESFVKAGKVSGAPSGRFETLVDTQGKAPSPFKTMADEFMSQIGLKVSSIEPGSVVPGRPVAPTTTNYQYANNIDKSIKDIRAAGEGFIKQVKGLFNIAYEGPVEPSAVVAQPVGPEPIRGVDYSKMALVILGIVYLVTT